MNPEIAIDRERLEANANALRARLANNLEVLDQRIHDSLDIKRQVVQHPVTGILITAGALLALVSGVGLVAYRVQQKQLRHQERWLLGAPNAHGWQPPQPAPPPRGLAKELVARILVSVATYVLAQLAKRALKKYVPKLGMPAPSR